VHPEASSGSALEYISLFNDENVSSACPGFAVEMNIAFGNSDFRSVSDFVSEYSTTTFLMRSRVSYSPNDV
jgi:hypothetical protein